MAEEIRPTGTLRAVGWPLIAVGLVLFLGLFQYAWIGATLLAAGIALVVVAAKRSADNREKVQRAALADRGAAQP